MFIYTFGDVIALVVILFFVLVWMTILFSEWFKQSRCPHIGGVTETRACHAICKQCGKNLGFIGTWRKK